MPTEKKAIYRKVTKQGGSRLLAVGKFIPKHFTIVKVVLEDTQNKDGREWVRLRIEKAV